MLNRTTKQNRDTKETSIQMELNLDGCGKAEIQTGIGFFDHMLDGFARHGLFDLSVYVDGDLEVDCHHTIEDTGILTEAEQDGAKKTLKAAAMTYGAATAVALAQLLRLIVLFGRRRRD